MDSKTNIAQRTRNARKGNKITEEFRRRKRIKEKQRMLLDEKMKEIEKLLGEGKLISPEKEVKKKKLTDLGMVKSSFTGHQD